ncbi:glycosyltransferase [Candidatus Pelagibacter ubique]|nr:glycosyltransferase [Candidatus Pelagibacter ubique]
MIKILSLTYKNNYSGGPYKVSVDYKKILDKSYFYVKLLYLSNNFYYHYIFNKKKIKEFVNKFDALHNHNIFSVKNLLIIKVAQSLAIPCICTLHGNLNKWSMNHNFLKKYFFLLFFKKTINSIALMHFLNESEKIDASKFINLNKIKYTIQQNCIDISQYKITRNNDSVFKILFFGRMDNKKNFLMIPDIASIFKKNYIKDVKFIIVGYATTKQLNNLKNKIKKLKLESFVEIRNSINTIEKKNALFEEIDAFILPSKDEADSIAIKESLASGKPVIISKECKLKSDKSCHDFIKIINDNLIQSYYEEIIKIYNKRDESKFLSQKIRQYAQANFSIDLINKKLPSIYLDCINHRHVLKN